MWPKFLADVRAPTGDGDDIFCRTGNGRECSTCLNISADFKALSRVLSSDAWVGSERPRGRFRSEAV